MGTQYAFSKLVVNDLAAAKSFYMDVYSLNEFEHIHDVMGEIAIEEIVLSANERGESWPADGLVLLHYPGRPKVVAGAMILGFTTDDLAGVLERVAAKGGSIESPIQTHVDRGVRIAFASDPEGNLSEIVEMMGG